MRSFRRQASVALAAALFATAGSAQVWQWTDAEGVVRYTPNPDRVPESQRGSLIKVEPGMDLPAPSPATPPVRYAPPEEIPFGADPFAAPEPARTLEVPDAESSAEPEPPRTPELPGAEGAARPVPRPAPSEAPATSTPPIEAPPPRTARTEAPGPSTAASKAGPPSAPPIEAPPPRTPPSDEPEPPAAPRPLSDAERARHAELEAQIAADQETLKALISREPAEGDDPLRESPELHEIARRLPALQAELRALEGVPERSGERAAPEP